MATVSHDHALSRVPTRSTHARVVAVLTVAAVPASACISTDRALPPPPDTFAFDTAVADTQPEEVTPPSDSDANDADAIEVGCVPEACPQPAAGECRVAICTDAGCGFKDAEEGAACDDGLPCRRDDYCVEGVCIPGSTFASDMTQCGDDDACNGIEHCDGHGECLLPSAPACTPDGIDFVCVNKQCVLPGMVPVLDGTFLMGCDPNDTAGVPAQFSGVPILTRPCPDGSTPRITVFLPAFAIDRTEVPESAFQACVAANACPARPPEDHGPADPSRPANLLRYGQAKELCKFLGKRLCRETEWEKAARGAADARTSPWGNADATCPRANFTEVLPAPPHSCSTDPNAGTVPVDSCGDGASPYGALNMLGNVREWVADAYDVGTYQAWYDAALQLHRGDSSAVKWIENPPAPPENHGSPVVRGLGWHDFATALRLDFRGSEAADTRADDLGVRCCAELPMAVTRPP